MHFPFCSLFQGASLFPPSRIADCSKALTIEKNVTEQGRSLLKRRRRRRGRHGGDFTLSGHSLRTTLSNEL